MTDKAYNGLKAQSALEQFKDEGGVDPSCYFDMVAVNLIARYGEKAIAVAAQALRKMTQAGDHEGHEMWQEISASLCTRSGMVTSGGSALH